MQYFVQRLSNRFGLLNSYLNGKEIAPTGPLDVLAEVTSHCNLLCPECRRLELIDKPSHMKWQVFESILKKASDHIELAFLFGWGEPLLWPKLFEAIALARELGIRTSISTNITMLKGELAKQMCEGGPDILTLALDSHDKEVYEHYRKGADFKEVSGNLHDFIALTKQIGKRSHLVLQMICSPQANEKASEYKKFAEQFSGTEIRYRRYRSAKPGVQNRTKRRPCPVLWRGPAYVRADGEVFPCCILLDQSLGNVLDSDLKSMWNSSKMHQLRKMHSTGRINELRECSTCYHSDPLEYSTVTAAAGFLWNSFLIRRLIPFSERLLLLKYKIRNSIRSLKAFFRRSSLKMR